MTEAAWIGCCDPAPMVNFLRGRENRKLRLLFCACARKVWHHLQQPEQRVIEVGELLADGAPVDADVAALRAEYQSPRSKPRWVAAGAIHEPFYILSLTSAVDLVVSDAVRQAMQQRKRNLPQDTFARQRAEQVELVRDIFGNPFRPVAFSPSWRTDTALALARQMYDSREFGAMPILADALQDAGCDSDDILAHCRGSGPHVRGCWVVDLVLGKE